MAYLAIRGSGSVNGVSALHGKVSRQLFAPLFPHWPEEEVPVGHVTNGVHMPTWDSTRPMNSGPRSAAKARWLGTMEAMEQEIRQISDIRLWQFRTDASTALSICARKVVKAACRIRVHPQKRFMRSGIFSITNTLTLGFARRFASYKRPNLLLHDKERLTRLLTSPQRPVQLVIAGKAHPADQAGQALIREWVNFIRRPEVRPHVVFLADYDMQLTEQLVQGVDVWLNTPRRPWEACGTSGMKVLVNGGINLSELDGWWAEAYTPEVGWALGDGQEHDSDPAWDAHEADALYDLLEHQVIPEFYARDERGIPVAWVSRMRESMARLTPRFSSNRSVREYTENHYLPAAEAYLERSAGQGAMGVQLVDWQRDLDSKWNSLRFGEMKIDTTGTQHVFEVQVYLDDLDPDAVCVELYADGVDGAPPVCLKMERVRQLVGAGYAYRAEVNAERAAHDYTARLIPYREGVVIPLESSRILWQK